MELLKPTTSQLMALLPLWPIAKHAFRSTNAENWRKDNVPWTWTPEEFSMQTRMLAMNDCAPRDLVAWLIHGVDWGMPLTRSSALMFKNQLWQWNEKAPYLRVWIEASNASVVEETLEPLCAQLDWHPIWKNLNLANIIDDFYWAREVVKSPKKVNAPRAGRSIWGSLELGQAGPDWTFKFACAEFIAKSMRWGMGSNSTLYSGTKELLDSASIELLPAVFQRSLLMASLKHGDPGIIDPDLCSKAGGIWIFNLSDEEQLWWETKAKSMVFTKELNQKLLDMEIHPLLFIYQHRTQDLALIKDLNPETFRMGYALINLLWDKCSDNTLQLPDLDIPGP